MMLTTVQVITPSQGCTSATAEHTPITANMTTSRMTDIGGQRLGRSAIGSLPIAAVHARPGIER
jgi:hypothetical protein